jgi:hypothetical protein
MASQPQLGGELPAAMYILTSSWPSSRAASPNTFRRPALLPQKTQIVRNLLAGAAAAPSSMPSIEHQLFR